MNLKELDQEKVNQFLQELTALSRKHSIGIAGCGCCGSPHLYANDGEDFSKQEYTAARTFSKCWEHLELSPIGGG